MFWFLLLPLLLLLFDVVVLLVLFALATAARVLFRRPWTVEAVPTTKGTMTTGPMTTGPTTKGQADPETARDRLAGRAAHPRRARRAPSYRCSDGLRDPAGLTLEDPRI